MQDIDEIILLKEGRMTKSPFDMTPDERNEWHTRIQENARIYCFSIGQPLVYKKDGIMIAEYSDGGVETVS